MLQYQRLPLSSGQARAALIIHDLTRQRQLEEELALQRTALPGAAAPHEKQPSDARQPSPGPGLWVRPEVPPVQTALLDTANRLGSLAATLDGIVQVSPGEGLPPSDSGARSAGTCSRPSCPPPAVSPSTWAARTVIVSADCASSVALVVNERWCRTP
ncbi:MAG: hypothetical protein ACLT3D_08460 [Lawsonibacter sp.]